MKYFLITQERDNVDISEFDDKEKALLAQKQFQEDYEYIQMNVLIEGREVELNEIAYNG